MRELALSAGLILAAIGFTTFSAPGCAHAETDVTRPETLDLRVRFHDFWRLAQVKQWAMEDKMLTDQRTFNEELRKGLRDLDVKIVDDTAVSETEWRAARRHAQDRKRQALAEARQKTKIHRDQAELELIVFERDRKAEVKDFLAAIEKDLGEFKKSQADAAKHHQGPSNESLVERALEDVHAAGEDLNQQISTWLERLKAIKNIKSDAESDY